MALIKSRIAAAALAGLVTFATTGPAWAPAEFFLKIEGIPGESRDEYHKNWIELNSISSATPPPGGGTMRMTARVSKASPKLQEAAAKGKVFPSVVLSVPARERKGYLKYTLEKVVISSYNVSGSGRAATETISLTYEEIKWE